MDGSIEKVMLLVSGKVTLEIKIPIPICSILIAQLWLSD